MNKKSVLLVLAVTFLLVGCGSKDISQTEYFHGQMASRAEEEQEESLVELQEVYPSKETEIEEEVKGQKSTKESTEIEEPKEIKEEKSIEEPQGRELNEQRVEGEPVEKDNSTQEESVEKDVENIAKNFVQPSVERDSQNLNESPEFSSDGKTPQSSVESIEQIPHDYESVTPEEEPSQDIMPPKQEHVCTYQDKVISEATCERARVVEAICTGCGKSGGQRSDGSPLGHDPNGVFTIWQAADCVVAGIELEGCKRCSMSSNVRDIAPLGHVMEVSSSEAGLDCTTRGVTKFSCSRCGETRQEENDIYGPHSYETKEWSTFELNDEGTEFIEIHHSQTICSQCGTEAN